ncbi:MAG: response regulator transcription factor [Cyclobacteriaceae bacterium]|nr:response regulator transcription factor [Cyclobacteriaceae bacterium]
MKLRCLIVDDEPLARKGMEDYVRAVDFLELAGVAADAAEADSLLRRMPFDLMLLDVQMPRQSGLQFLRSLKDPPLVILTTAFSEFALEGYELDVVDYLVKPIPFDRFLKAVVKAKDYAAFLRHKEPSSKTLFVKSGGRLERISIDEILFVEGLQNYVVIHRATGKLIVYMTLSGMMAQLPEDRFMRVHKSYVVALPEVSTIEGHTLILGDHRIPVSRTLKDEVVKRIVGANRMKR